MKNIVLWNMKPSENNIWLLMIYENKYETKQQY